ncbi:MAG: hypothetical protein DMD92_15750, partial [Candidatus Rokuibacteriota bacterium]
AAERVGAAGQVIIQSQHPSHYAFDAVARQDLAGFYKHELKFRAELGYPPFRRLAFVTARGRTPAETAALAERASAALAAASELTVYPPLPDRRERMRRIVVKGRADLPRRLEGALASFREGGAPRRGIIDVEVDPLEWPF